MSTRTANKYEDVVFRMCGKEYETQEHAIPKLKQKNPKKPHTKHSQNTSSCRIQRRWRKLPQKSRWSYDHFTHTHTHTWYDAVCVFSPGVSPLARKVLLPPDLDLGKCLLAQQTDRRKEFEELTKMNPATDNPTLLSLVWNVIPLLATHKTLNTNLAIRHTPKSKGALLLLKNKVQFKLWNRKGDLLIASTYGNWFHFLQYIIKTDMTVLNWFCVV